MGLVIGIGDMDMAVKRVTVDLRHYPDLVMILLGMRVNSVAGLRTLLGFGPRISNAAKEMPDGLLSHETFLPVSRNRAQVVAFTIAASLIIAPAVAGTPIGPRTRRKRKSIRAQAYRLGVWVPIRALAASAERCRITVCITSSLQGAPAPSSRCQEFC